MKRNSLLLVAVTLIVAMFPIAASAKAPSPVVTVDLTNHRVVATDLTPGTQAFFFGYGAATTGYDRSFVEWHELVTDDDHDGTVTFTTTNAIPWRSIWVVVDTRNAQFGVGAPAGYHIAVPEHRRKFARGDAGLLDTATSMAPWVSAAYVHPGGGVWLVSADDGQPQDADNKRDGLTSIALRSFAPLGVPGERPREFVPGGVLIVIDPFHMRLDTVRLDGSVLDNGGPR